MSDDTPIADATFAPETVASGKEASEKPVGRRGLLGLFALLGAVVAPVAAAEAARYRGPPRRVVRRRRRFFRRRY